MYMSKQWPGLGDATLTFPFLSPDCVVGATDPLTGDTIANCPPPLASPAAVPGGLVTMTDSMTVTAKAYPAWLYVGAGVLGLALVGSLFGGKGRR
jgi:hypothetical protein